MAQGDDFARGTRVGKYEVLTRLSMGGMAELSLAVLPGPGGFQKFVALKQILPDVRRDEAFVKMFLDEARLTAGLNHPNIAQVFELGHDPDSGELYIALEFIAGQTVMQIMKRAHSKGLGLPFGFSCRVVRDACLALQSAHAFVDPAGEPRPVIHRDVSPNNLMVAFTGTVKVIDFGLAKARGRLGRTQVGMVKGTVGYMSPEQVLDDPLDSRTDLFSAAAVLYELLAGRALFSAEEDRASMQRIAEQDAPPLSSVAPDVPKRLSDVVMRGLARDREARWQTGRDFARAIEAACPLFDEEEMAGLMGELFPDTKALTRSLLESAAAPTVDPKRITRTVAALKTAREADRRPEPPGPMPAEVSTQPRAAPKARSKGLATMLVVGAVLLVAGGLVIFEPWSLEEQHPGPTAMEALEGDVMPQVRAAMGAHDYTRAEQLATTCRIGGVQCPKAVAAVEEIHAMPKPVAARVAAPPELVAPPVDSPAPTTAPTTGCDLARCNDLVQSLDWEAATAALRKCSSPDGHVRPDAAAMLNAMTKEHRFHEELLAAKRQLDEGQFKEARDQHLVFSRSAKLLHPAYVELSRRADAMAVKAIVPPKPVPEAKTRDATPDELQQAGRDLLDSGKTSQAIVMLQRCVLLATSSPQCHKLLGTAYLRRARETGNDQDERQGTAEYRRFLELAPHDREAPAIERLLQGSR